MPVSIQFDYNKHCNNIVKLRDKKFDYIRSYDEKQKYLLFANRLALILNHNENNNHGKLFVKTLRNLTRSCVQSATL